MKRRVVFIPGIMGSVLVDSVLNAKDKKSLAKEICEKNLGAVLSSAVSAYGDEFAEKPNPCLPPHNPAVVWGGYGMFHWIFDTDEWLQRLTRGNGIDQPGTKNVSLAVPKSKSPAEALFKIDIKIQLLGGITAGILGVGLKDPENFKIDPYGDFIEVLRGKSDIDLLIFPYDWRLSIAYNATRLAEAIQRRLGWKFKDPDNVPIDEQITIVAHSMGGLIARFYIESNNANLSYIRKDRVRNHNGKIIDLNGHRFVRSLITVGTPHLGSPEAYLSFIRELSLLEKRSSFLSFLREQLYLPKLFDLAVETERKLIIRRTGLPIPKTRKVTEEDPVDSDLLLRAGQNKDLVERFSGLIEMFPAYWFMHEERWDEAGSRKLLDLDKDAKDFYERYPKGAKFGQPGGGSWPRLRHNSNKLAWEMFAEFRKKLIPPGCLDKWLMDKEVHYHLIGSYTTPTITDYNPGTPNPIKPLLRGGDGVVPTWSALLDLPSNVEHTNLHLHQLGSKEHQELFHDEDIQRACLEIVSYPKGYNEDSAKAERVPVNRLKQIDLLIREIIDPKSTRKLRSRIVISVITIHFDNPDHEGIIPSYDVDKGTFPTEVYAKANTPWESPGPTGDWTIEFEDSGQSIGRRRIIGIGARGKTFNNIVHGGVIFLPETRCQNYLEILSWNLGERQLKCFPEDTNCGHAEYQFTSWFSKKFLKWFKEQRERHRWKSSIKAIEIENKGSGAFSPCQECVVDLTNIGNLLAGSPDKSIGKVSWGKAYDSLLGGGITLKRHLDKLESAGWDIDADSRKLILR